MLEGFGFWLHPRGPPMVGWGGVVKIKKKSITQSKLDGFVSNLICIFRAMGDIIYVTGFYRVTPGGPSTRVQLGVLSKKKWLFSVMTL